MERGDERVLSYGDVLLRRSDVALLDAPHFLNDNVIEFFFNYLSKEYGSSSCEANELSPLNLVGPTVTFWLLHCPDADGIKAAIDPLRFPERETVIFALNNNEDLETAEGGTHWTLLLFNRQRKTFEHFDSMAGTNWKQARDLVNIIKPYMGSGVSGARLIEQATPQQENCYDCGVYVIAIAQVLCSTFQEKKSGKSNDYVGLVMSTVNQSFVNRMRQSTLELIFSLSASDKTEIR